MKRLTALLGRCGTTILVIGLALFLVSLIPPMQAGSYLGSGHVSETWLTGYEGVLTPQQTLHLTVTANGTLNVYVLEVRSSTIYNWILEHYPSSIDFSNVTYFDQFLDSNPASIAWKTEIHNETIEHEYVPTRIVNATLAISNHSPDLVSTVYTSSLSSGAAPAAKVLTLSEFVIPIGAVITLPWLTSLLRARKRRKG